MEETLTPSDRAKVLLSYFERLARESDEDVWARGAEVTREWLRLMNNDDITQTDVSAFLSIVRANRHRSSGWLELATAVYEWTKQQGFVVPAYAQFFKSGLNTPALIAMSPHEFAEFIAENFEEKIQEDPGQKIWELGLFAARQWVGLIDMDVPSEDDLSSFIKFMDENSRWQALEWSYMVRKIFDWTIENGYSTLWPGKYQSKLE